MLGRGGLLGASTEKTLGRATEMFGQDGSFSWSDREVAVQIGRAVARFADRVGPSRWQVVWCAGASVVTSDTSTLELETWTLECLLGELGKLRESGRIGPGTFFFASSAGGLYAGSDMPPFDEATPPRPIAPYGQAKLQQERAVEVWSTRVGVPSLIGRIANLYGPGQDLAKPQGLISQLCWSQILQRPLSVYVPLSTMRDYLYAPDCAVMIAKGLEEISDEHTHGGGVTVKVMASQRPVSVGAVLGEFRRVLRRNPRVSLRATPLARHQVLDLRLRSRSMGAVDRYASTPFPVGLRATFDDLRARFAASHLERQDEGRLRL